MRAELLRAWTVLQRLSSDPALVRAVPQKNPESLKGEVNGKVMIGNIKGRLKYYLMRPLASKILIRFGCSGKRTFFCDV